MMSLEDAKRILAALDREGVRYVLVGSPKGDYSLDILSRLGEAFRYEDLEWQEMVLDGIRVRVATPRMLYRMKKDTVRPRDKADAAALKDAFGLAEE